MKRFGSILTSIFMSLVIVTCTVVQFHHHDAQGNIYITLSVACQLELDSHGHFCACHHSHDSGCHNSDRSEDPACSMHIDETPVCSSLKMSAPQELTLLQDMAITENTLQLSFKANDCKHLCHRCIANILKSIDRPLISRRGPPVLYI